LNKLTRDGPPERLPLWQALVFSGAGLPVSALGFALVIYLPPHLSRDLGVPLAVVGGSWALVRVLDVLVDPVLGVLMDGARTRIGRYRPWMLLGAPILMAGVYMLFLAPPGITQVYLVSWLLVLYLAISILQLGHLAWCATLATTYGDRSRLFGWMTAIGVMSSVGILMLPVISAGLHQTESQSVHAMGWFLIALTPIVVGLAVWLVPERVNPAIQRQRVRLADYLGLLTKPDLVRLYLAQVALTLGPGWMSSIYLFFAKDVMKFTSSQSSLLLLTYLAGGLLGAPLLSQMATRIGKHRTLMIAAAAYSIGLCTVLLPPKGVMLASVPVMLWCGFMGVSFEMTIRSMLADVADEVRLEQGKERLSLIFALNTLTAKLAAAFAIGLTFPLLQFLGYLPKAGAANTPEAIRSLAITFIAGPIVFVMLGAACVIGWRMTASHHAKISAELALRDAEAAFGGVDSEHLGDAVAAAQARA
jgi:Na+/melibiose symporter-like transporter